ncbi:MAG: hypothetical protein AAGJ95_00485 [Cyanobacteria bacterium J06554_11]
MGISEERGGRLDAILIALGDTFRVGSVSFLTSVFNFGSVFKESTIFMVNKAESSAFCHVFTAGS